MHIMHAEGTTASNTERVCMQLQPPVLLPEYKRQKTVVCVTDQLRCDRIIRSGRTVANMTDTDLVVINVCTPLRRNDPEAMEYLYRVSAEFGAEMNVLFAADFSKAIVSYIKENRVRCVLTGVPQEHDNFITRMWRTFTHITFFMVEQNGEFSEVTRSMIAQWEKKRA